MTKINLN